MVGPANEHDSTRFVETIESVSIQSGARPRTRPVAVYADKAYDSRTIRKYLASRGIKSRIPKRIWNGGKKKRTGKRYAKVRSSVERFFAWLKCGFRRVSVRYERLDEVYIGFLNLASFLMYWRVLG